MVSDILRIYIPTVNVKMLNTLHRNGNVVTHRQTPIEKAAYQQHLEEGLPAPQLNPQSIRYWSDFSRIFYHPRSIVQLNEYELNSRLMPFEKWDVGEELFSSLDKEHDLLDRDLRPFAEECDQLQGLQLFTGIDDAWGGFAARYMDRLRDEFGKTSIWVWGFEDGARVEREKHMLRMVNTARTIHEVSSQASAFVPVADPPRSLPGYVGMDRSSQWHTSALVTTAVETMTLPSRLRAGNGRRGVLADLEAALNENGNQRIYQLRESVLDPEANSGKAAAQGRDSNGHARTNGHADVAEDVDTNVEDTDYDMDFFAAPLDTKRRLRLFGSVEVERETAEQQQESEPAQDEGLERRRRRMVGLPNRQR